MSSLLRQGAAKLGRFTRRPGVREIRERALHDADRAEHEADIRLRTCPPPKLMLTLEGRRAPAPREAVHIEIPPS